MEVASGNLEALLETLPKTRLQWLCLPDASHQGAPQARLAGSRRLLGLWETTLETHEVFPLRGPQNVTAGGVLRGQLA